MGKAHSLVLESEYPRLVELEPSATLPDVSFIFLGFVVLTGFATGLAAGGFHHPRLSASDSARSSRPGCLR